MTHRPVSSWSKEQVDAVEAWMGLACPRLHVDHWTIVLQPDVASDGKCGTIEWLHGRHYAKLWLAGDFLDDPEPEQRETLTHELIHLRLSAMTDACRNDLVGLLGKPAHSAFYEPWDRQMELAVDDLARTIAPTLPPIAWPTGEPEAKPELDALRCRRCGKGVREHSAFGSPPPGPTWVIEADFPDVPFTGLYCFTWPGVDPMPAHVRQDPRLLVETKLWSPRG